MIAFQQNEHAPNAVMGQVGEEMKSAVKSKSVRRASRRRTVAPAKTSKLPLTPRQIQLLRDSFRRIEPQAGIAGLIFYRNLFTLDPSLRPLFQSSIELQGKKLMEALNYTVTTIDFPEMLAPALEALGRRHVTYGTRNEHYATVVKALLQTLAETLSDAFTPETRDAWKAALEFVAQVMKRGAAPLRCLKSSA